MLDSVATVFSSDVRLVCSEAAVLLTEDSWEVSEASCASIDEIWVLSESTSACKPEICDKTLPTWLLKFWGLNMIL